MLSSSSSCAPSLNVFVLILTEVTLSYVCSRIYLHNPPGDENDSLMPHPEIPAEALLKEQELAQAEPEVNPWACILLLFITVGLMGVTAAFVRPYPVFPYSPATLSQLLPTARRQRRLRPKRITDQRRVRCSLAPTLTYLQTCSRSAPFTPVS